MILHKVECVCVCPECRQVNNELLTLWQFTGVEQLLIESRM